MKFVETGLPSAVASNAWDGFCATLIAEKGAEALASGTRIDVEAPAMPDLYCEEWAA